jgi:hypothetical protein
MSDEMKPGDYIALGDLLIRAAMDTTNSQNIVGKFFNGNQFKVFEIMPEKLGILWARISETTGQGQARFVALRVNGNVKAQMQKAFESDAAQFSNNLLVSAINRLSAALEKLAARGE